jgi:hypothetical protein
MRDAVCRSVGLPAYAIGPSSWERFVEGAQASSALHSRDQIALCPTGRVHSIKGEGKTGDRCSKDVCRSVQ